MADLTFEKISSYFHLPINEASRELKVCATILKKVCRASGISRWPHRKIRSLDNMINQLKAQLDSTSNEQERQRIQAEIFSFEEKKEYITQNPNTSYKSIVPKSTLQSFSKSKSKTTTSSNNNNNSKFVVTPKSEEEVLEVLTKLSQVETPLHYHHHNNNVNNNNVNNFNDDNNGDFNNQNNNYGKHKYILPLKKEILKMEREKEKLKLLSQSNFSLSSPFEDFNHNNNNDNNNTAIQSTTSSLNGTIVNTISATTTSVIDQDTLNNTKGSIQNIVHQPIAKENSANIQIISFDHNNSNNNNKDSNSKKRKYDEFAESMESLDEFRKFKSTFPSLKYHRIWENDCSLVYISHHIN